jgi:hypothetical protein
LDSGLHTATEAEGGKKSAASLIHVQSTKSQLSDPRSPRHAHEGSHICDFCAAAREDDPRPRLVAFSALALRLAGSDSRHPHQKSQPHTFIRMVLSPGACGDEGDCGQSQQRTSTEITCSPSCRSNPCTTSPVPFSMLSREDRRSGAHFKNEHFRLSWYKKLVRTRTGAPTLPHKCHYR